MTIKSQSPIYAITGLLFTLFATLIGIHMSSAIESTPALIGTISAVWCAVSVSILSSKFSESSR